MTELLPQGQNPLAETSSEATLSSISPSVLGGLSLAQSHFVSDHPSSVGPDRLSNDDLKAKVTFPSLNLTLRKVDGPLNGRPPQIGDGDSGRPRLPSDLSANSTAQCRICFSASGDIVANGGMPTLIHPCACDGSIRFCHPECLLQWVRQSGSFICELCKTRYRIRRSGLKKYTQWRMPSTDSIDWIHLVIFFFSICFIVGSIIWMTWLGLGQRMTVADQATHSSVVRTDDSTGTLGDFMVPAFILYSIIDILFVLIAGMELIFTIAPLVRKWYRINQTLLIENYAGFGNTLVPPREVNANMIAAATNPDGSTVINLQASIPCVNEERQHERVGQDHIL